MKNRRFARILSFFLALTLLCTSNPFGVGTVIVKAVEAEETHEPLVDEEPRPDVGVGTVEEEAEPGEESGTEEESGIVGDENGTGEDTESEMTDETEESVKDDADDDVNDTSDDDESDKTDEPADEEISDETDDTVDGIESPVEIEEQVSIKQYLSEPNEGDIWYGAAITEDVLEEFREFPGKIYEGYDIKYANSLSSLWNELGTGAAYVCIGQILYGLDDEVASEKFRSDSIIEIPANIKEVIIANWWQDVGNKEVDPEEEEWINRGLFANGIKVQGGDTRVSFERGSRIHTCSGDTFTIEFTSADENKSTIFIGRGAIIDADVQCVSTSGTVVIEGDIALNGYTTKAKTEFRQWEAETEEGTSTVDGSTICINKPDAGKGVSFQGIGIEDEKGVYVTIIYNGYPDDPKLLPRFNQPFYLGTGQDEEGQEYDRGINIAFWDYGEQEHPFDFVDDWWEKVDAVELDKGDRIAWFAGITPREKEEIGCRVFYYTHGGKNEELWINSRSGRLRQDGDEDPYRILVFDNKDAFDDVTLNHENYDKLWREEDYGQKWDEIETLDDIFAEESVEYVAIQATKASYDIEDKDFILPDHIKGAILASDWDSEAEARVPWQMNSLTAGSDADIYIVDMTVDTLDRDFDIKKGQVVLRNTEVNGSVNISQSADVRFDNSHIRGVVKGSDNAVTVKEMFIVNGFEGFSQLNVDPGATFVVYDAEKLVFNEVVLAGEGDEVYFDLLYNGYPDAEEKLPMFNGSITAPEDRGINLRFAKHSEEKFWESEGDWWEELKDETLEPGTKVAGTTLKGRDMVSLEQKLWYNTRIEGYQGMVLLGMPGGRLVLIRDMDEAPFRVLAFDDSSEFDNVKHDLGKLWGDENNQSPYEEKWNFTGALTEFLDDEDTGYVAIQARKASHDIADKVIKLPANIKGALLVGDWDGEADVGIPWKINGMTAYEGTEICMNSLLIDSEGQDINIAINSADQSAGGEHARITVEHTNVAGNINVSGKADVCLADDRIRGSVNVSGTVEIANLLVTDCLTGYNKLIVRNETSFIMNKPEKLVFDDLELVPYDGSHDGDENINFTVIYNGYPDDPDKLPLFKKVITGPDETGVYIRYIEKTEEAFWDMEGDPDEGWWGIPQDVDLTPGMLFAKTELTDQADIDELMRHVGYSRYNPSDQKWLKYVGDGNIVVAQSNPETGKEIITFGLSTDAAKIYDGKAFDIKKESIYNNCGYIGDITLSWEKPDGTALAGAPVDVGTYVLKVVIPADTEGYEGSAKIDITINKRPITVSAKPESYVVKDGFVDYEIVGDGFIGDDTFITKPEADEGEVITENGESYYTITTRGGEVGSNYEIVHAEPVKIKVVNEDKPAIDGKPAINSVLFPKKKETYTAVYTGEQIRPTMVVAYKYRNEKGTAKTQTLKLNVDYTVSYTSNINAGTASVTVRGIGGYSGTVTKNFTITPKSIKNVKLSSVGDVLYGDKPWLVVTDGNRELIEGVDYEIVCSTEGSATENTQAKLQVKGKENGNYDANTISSSKAKFNILQTAVNNSDLKTIGAVTIELKLPTNGYTYNGKQQKPKVVVRDGGTKVAASRYKVIYTNNVNACGENDTNAATVRVVGVSKNGKGYYGVSNPVTFAIKQKDFSKVSVSSVPAIPKTRILSDVTFTVKDGKHILAEGVDYTVDYSNIAEEDRSIKSGIAIGTKYEVYLKPVSGNYNYQPDTKKIVKVKFGQQSFASKTANVSIKILDPEQQKVKVRYNGIFLTQGTDFTATVTKEKNKPTYKVTIKAVNKSAYKGQKVFTAQSYTAAQTE